MSDPDTEMNGEQPPPDKNPPGFSKLVDALVNDILSARFSAPYPEDIVDQVCLAIDSNAEWRRRYDELVKLPKVQDGSDGSWAVNNRITKSITHLTGMKVIRNKVPATNQFMKSYSPLMYPDKAETGEVQVDEDVFERAVERLRQGIPSLKKDDYLTRIQRGRDEVYARYGHSFAPERLPELTADEYLSFLRFENNHHWTGINRHGSRTVQDMPALRAALAVLLDEEQQLAKRYDQATGGMVAGIGRAIATAVLHVVCPERYGVWNTKVEAGLRELDLHPDRAQMATDGQLYAAVNEVLRQLAAALDIDLWTLDNLWEWMTRRRTLATPFDKIFADSAQAEWAFDLFADAVERLGGGPNDPRFALTLPRKDMMRLNIGNSMVIDIANQGKEMHLTALIVDMERAYKFSRSESFRVTVKGTDKQFAVYTIPPEGIEKWPAEIQSIFERSMVEFGKEFVSWQKSNIRWAHNSHTFEAFFDEEKREELFTRGLAPTRYWRITMPSDLGEDLSNKRGPYNLWAECLRHGVAAIDFDNDLQHPQVKKFARIAPGDFVVAFLRNRTIGGIGVVTSPFDEQTARERSADRDFFRGGFWQRIGVDWTPQTIDVDRLPTSVQNKFGTQTVLEISESDFAEVERLIDDDPPPPLPDGPSIATEFKGFTMDAFAFLHELAANNNKAWMKANRERWKTSVLEPMKKLFTDLGLPIKSVFDPYLLPDSLEIEPTTRRTLANIYRNWAATELNLYHHYYWGAFYRDHLKRQTDAQLFITLFADQFRFGFFVGRGASSVRSRFRERVLKDPEGFYRLIAELGLSALTQFGWSFETGDREIVDVNSAEDLIRWVDSGDYELLRVLVPEEVINLGPSLADRVFDTFRRVFPIYLWAVADDYEAAVEQYLEREFLAEEDDEAETPPIPYTFTDFTYHTHLTNARAEELRVMLEDKQQAIFYGPPGTGKTYVARHLAKLITGLTDPPPDRLTVVQFHPAYGYEEFIEGIRPQSEKDDGGRAVVDYPVRSGTFVRFCRAAERIDGPCVFIIDEFNRGNIPRIFGELMYLLEYRSKEDSIPLPYSGERFRIPPNVFIIGTMNTADRSIALVDFALRRRFHFAHFTADPDLFERWLDAHPSTVPYLRPLYRELSTRGIDDPDYAIGPSVFMRDDLNEEGLRRVWEWSVLPSLREYHIDRIEAVRPWEWDSPEMLQLRGRLTDAEQEKDLDVTSEDY